MDKLRDALGRSVTDLEAEAARPAIVREAQVWSEAEIKEVEAIRDRLNAFMVQRNRAVRADLIVNGTPQSFAVARLVCKRQIGEPDWAYEKRVCEFAKGYGTLPEPEPRGPRGDAQREEAARLAAKDVAFDERECDSMELDLRRRDDPDEAIQRERREALQRLWDQTLKEADGASG